MKISSLNCTLNENNGIALVEVSAPLTQEDFKILSQIIDPYIEKNGQLNGIIIHTKKFPGWKNLNSFFSHIKFIKNHHRKIVKLAAVADGIMANFMPALANYFVKAQVKHFAYDQLEEAKKWVNPTYSYQY